MTYYITNISDQTLVGINIDGKWKEHSRHDRATLDYPSDPRDGFVHNFRLSEKQLAGRK